MPSIGASSTTTPTPSTPTTILREGTLLVAMERAIEQACDLHRTGPEYGFAAASLTADELVEIFPETGHGTVIVVEA